MHELLKKFLNVSELTAAVLYDHKGLVNSYQADLLAVNNMIHHYNKIAFKGRVAIGEGERDQAPMICGGDVLGSGISPEIDIAIDPLEGTNLFVNGDNGAIIAACYASPRSIITVPDIYMKKIVVGPNLPQGIIDIDESISDNILKLSEAKRCRPQDLCIKILDRPRHKEIINSINNIGSKLELISDGDILAIMDVLSRRQSVDMYVGVGGAPEGVISAAIVKALKGQMQAKLLPKNDKEKDKIYKVFGEFDLEKVLFSNGMIRGECLFIATAVTDNNYCQGVRKVRNKYFTESIVVDSRINEINIVPGEFVM